MPRLLIYGPSHGRIAAALAARGPGLETATMDAEGRLTIAGVQVAAEDAGIDIAWLNAEVFESPAARAFMTTALKSPNLEWIHSAGAGFDHPVFKALVGKGARLTTSHGQAIGMAEYVLAGVLDHLQRGPERRAAQAEGVWRRLPFREVMGSSWLVIGFGAIGQAVAQRARSFGASIVGVRRDQAPHPLADRIDSIRDVSELLPAADVVVLCAPLNADTRHLADAGFFAAMREGSVLVNVGRGALVDEAALLDALDLGTPQHAVLDVFETEPLPVENRLWTHPRVAINAHASGIGSGNAARNQALFLENLALYLAGKPLIGEIYPADVLGS
ncbi:MAG: D-2-hydroxyacid dehydrogenase [Caulobacteraceae bacterium]